MIEEKLNLYRNISAERVLIAYVLRSDWKVSQQLTKEIFTIYPFQIFLGIVQRTKMVINGKTLASIIKAEFPSQYEDFKTYGEKIYKEIMDGVDEKNIVEIVANLEKLSEIRALLGGVDSIISMIAPDTDFNLEKAQTILCNCSKPKTKKPVSSGDYLEDFEWRMGLVLEKKRMKEESSSGIVGVPSGIPVLDSLTGGFMKDELILIGGETNVGKSIFVENMAVHAFLYGFNIALISLEMRRDQVQFRLDSRLSCVSYSKFRTANLESADLDIWGAKIQELRDISKNFLEISYLPNVSVDAIEVELNRIQDKRGVEIDEVIVDYMNLLQPPKRLKSGVSSKDALAQSEIAWELRMLAGNFNDKGVPVITPVQLTDESKRTDYLNTSHIKYSRGSTEHASVIYALKQTKDNKLEGVLQLQTLKSRDSVKPKPILLRPNFDVMLINQEKIESFSGMGTN